MCIGYWVMWVQPEEKEEKRTPWTKCKITFDHNLDKSREYLVHLTDMFDAVKSLKVKSILKLKWIS